MADAFAELNTILDGLDNTASGAQGATDNNVGTNNTPGTEGTTDPASGGTQQQPPAAQPQTPANTPDTQTQTQPQQPDTSNQAFAAMRTQNAQLQKLLENLSGIVGVDSNLKGAQLIQAMEAKALDAQAAKLNTSPELLAQVQQQNAMLNAIVQERQKATVFNKFSSLQQELGLSKDQVYQFVGELQSAGYDLNGALDHLPAIYRGMHYDELMAQAKQNAVQQALTHDNQVNSHSSNPGQMSGNAGAEDGKVQTVNELDALLNDAKF